MWLPCPPPPWTPPLPLPELTHMLESLLPPLVPLPPTGVSLPASPTGGGGAKRDAGRVGSDGGGGVTGVSTTRGGGAKGDVGRWGGGGEYCDGSGGGITGAKGGVGRDICDGDGDGGITVAKGDGGRDICDDDGDGGITGAKGDGEIVICAMMVELRRKRENARKNNNESGAICVMCLIKL